jgi:hypothetical protein
VLFLVLALMMINYMSINLLMYGDSFLNISRSIIIFLLVVCFSRKPVISRQELTLLFFSVVGIIVGEFRSPIGINIIFITLFTIAMKKFTINKFSHYSLFLVTFAIIFCIGGLNLGFIENKIDTTAALIGLESFGDRNRSTFGFTNVNAFSALISSFIFLLLISWKKNTSIKYLFCTWIVYFFYKETDSRTVVISIMFYFIFIIYYKFAFKYKKFLNLSALFFLLIPVIITLMSNFLLEKLPFFDILLSFRISYVASLFGGMTFINWLVGGYSPVSNITVDNSFALILCSMGLPFLIYLIWITSIRLNECILKNEAEIYAFILAFWYYSFSESNMVRPEMLVGIIFWLFVLRTKENSNKIENINK